MDFKAQSKGQSYKVHVKETSELWVIHIEPERGKPSVHEIPKFHYKELPSAISLIYKQSSYLLDAMGDGNPYFIYTRGSFRHVFIQNEKERGNNFLRGSLSGISEHKIKCEIPGKVIKILTKEGEKVSSGQPLIVLEAMKMENEIVSNKSGIIKKIHIQLGETTSSNQTLLSFEKDKNV